MRGLSFLLVLTLVAGIASTGCGGKKEEAPGGPFAAEHPKRGDIVGRDWDGDESPPAARREKEWAKSRDPGRDPLKAMKEEREHRGRDKARDKADPPREFAKAKEAPALPKALAKPDSREAAAEAMVAKGGPGAIEPPPAKKDRKIDPDGGILTAGSFDDNLFPGPYRNFVKKLSRNQSAQDLTNRFLGHRLVVTVKNGAGQPVGNARLTIRPADGGAGVALRTRTDGRAVFLSSWDEVPVDGDLLVTVTPPDGSKEVQQTAARGATACEVKLPAAAAPLPLNLDLVLVLDTTGSMGDELEYLKNELRSIVTAIGKQFPNVRQRYGLVCYRDEGDEYLTRSFPFTESLQQLRTNLAAQSAAGGGDPPEAMHKGLEEAVKLDWRDDHTARVLFLLADAPPHAEHTRRTFKAIDALRKKGVALYPVACSGYDDACEFVMRTGALLTGAEFVFLTDDSGVGDKHGEPHIPHYHVERLNHLMVRMIAGELAGRRVMPHRDQIVRTFGRPIQVGARE
jgi:hypothetical protein